MIQVTLDGKTREVDKLEFLALLSYFARNTCIVGRALYRCYTTGALDKRAEARHHFLKQTEFQSLENVIRHDELKETIVLITAKVRLLEHIDDRITELLSEQGGTPAHTSDQKTRKRSPFKGLSQHEYRILVDQVHDAIVELQFAQLVTEKLVRKISATRSFGIVQDNTSLEFSTPSTLPSLRTTKPLRPRSFTRYEPTTKDLIDAALVEVEPDGRRAIRMLKKALSYSPTGLLASEAYLVLGMRYEELGEDKKAIQFYTKSMEEIGLPDANTLLWRGQAHFRLGHLDEAQSDLQRAIELGLDYVCLEEAKSCLAEIRSKVAGK